VKKLLQRLILLLVTFVLCFGLAELAWRALRKDGPDAEMFFVDDGGKEWREDDPELLAGFASAVKRFVQPVPPGRRPMPPSAFLPGAHFAICYSGPAQDYFDDRGCVDYQFNSVGVREEDDLTFDKPEGQYRILCIGDSFTLGWGVRAEDNWTHLVEQRLQEGRPSLRTINAGMAGHSYADEYWLSLEHRLHRFGPDMVLVSLCLNDLIITNGKLVHYREMALPDHLRDLPPAWWEGSRMLRDLAVGLDGDPLALDPDRDVVQELLHLPADHPYYTNKQESPELYWGKGTPQKALTAMANWCRKEKVRFGVVIWPLFQGLGSRETYPFTSLHAMVEAFCAENGIACLDLLPAFVGHDARSLWVSPVDQHGNDEAMRIAAEPVAEFARRLGDL